MKLSTGFNVSGTLNNGNINGDFSLNGNCCIEYTVEEFLQVLSTHSEDVKLFYDFVRSGDFTEFVNDISNSVTDTIKKIKEIDKN